jgi:hypothetical protein
LFLKWLISASMASPTQKEMDCHITLKKALVLSLTIEKDNVKDTAEQQQSCERCRPSGNKRTEL